MRRLNHMVNQGKKHEMLYVSKRWIIGQKEKGTAIRRRRG